MPGDRGPALYDSVLGLNVLKGQSYLVLTATVSVLGRQPSDAAVRAKLIRLPAIAPRRI